MNKKAYQQPRLHTVIIHIKNHLLDASPVRNVESGDADINYSGGGSGAARVRQHNVWDDDWSE